MVYKECCFWCTCNNLYLCLKYYNYYYSNCIKLFSGKKRRKTSPKVKMNKLMSKKIWIKLIMVHELLSFINFCNLHVKYHYLFDLKSHHFRIITKSLDRFKIHKNNNLFITLYFLNIIKC